jgi:hypothetical protein
MLSDAFAKQDHTCFQGQRGDRFIQNLRTRKPFAATFPLHLLSVCVIAGETELSSILWDKPL